MIPLAYLPLAMIAAGVVFLFVAARVLVQQRRILEVAPYSNVTIELPKKWDDAEVTRLLQRYHDQPTVLSHAVASIKARMIMGQDLKTAQRRLQLIASVIELFKLNREMQGILYDIHLAEKDFEIRQVETQVRHEDTQARLLSERRLRELRAKREELQLNHEIAQLDQEIGAIKNPPKDKPELTPQQQKEQRHAASEARIQKLKSLKQDALKIEDSAERIQKVNAIDDELQREMQDWSRTL